MGIKSASSGIACGCDSGIVQSMGVGCVYTFRGGRQGQTCAHATNEIVTLHAYLEKKSVVEAWHDDRIYIMPYRLSRMLYRQRKHRAGILHTS
jgi:hypothetical protein